MYYRTIVFCIYLVYFQINAQTTYYISNSEGSDSNNGKTESTPWKSLDKLHSSWNQIGPGDKILFKRGDEWAPGSVNGRNAVIEITNKNANISSPILVSAYGAGALPILSASGINHSKDVIRLKGACSYIYFRDIKFDGKFMFNMDRIEFGVTTGMHHIKITDFEMINGRIYMDNYMPGISHVPESNDPYCNPFYKIEIGDGIMTEGTGEDMINFIFWD
jgi:hypothetical protein